MNIGNGKPLHEIMAQMLEGNKLEEDGNVVGKQNTSIKVDKDVKAPVKEEREEIDTANIIKSAPTREDPNKREEVEDADVDGIADGILVVTDPEITSEEFEEVADELQGIVDNAEAGEVPFTDKYEGDYILSCPICGGTFVNDTLLDSGEDVCPICCKVPDAFVVNGRVENSEAAVDKEEVQDDIEHEENLEEPDENDLGTNTDIPENTPEEDEEEENPMRKESKQVEGNKLQETKKLQEDEYSEYMEQEKRLAEEYKDRIKELITPMITTAFNDMKDILDEGDDLEEFDGFYFPSKAIAIMQMTNKEYHLNSNMDLTISDTLNLIDDNDTVEEAVDFLFAEYKADSAYSWADNFITILGKLDFDVIDEDEDLEEYEDYDELEEYNESKKSVNEGKITESKNLDLISDIEDALNNCLAKIYEKYNVKTGDIAPEQALEWDNIIDRLNKLFSDLVNQNKVTEGKSKKQEYIEHGNSRNPLRKSEFKSIKELNDCIKSEGLEVLNGDEVTENDSEFELFDPEGWDGEAWCYNLRITSDGDVKVEYDAKSSYNMTESKKVTEAEGGSASEELNTGTLSVVDVDTYWTNNFVQDYGCETEDIDSIIMDIAPKYIEEAVNGVLPGSSVTPIKVYHPSQYNYGGDELEFTLNYNVEAYNKLKEQAVADEAFKDFLKNNYSSHSGFVSYMADDLDEFETQDSWKQLVQVLMYAIQNNVDLDSIKSRFSEEFFDEVTGSFPLIEDEEDLDESKKTEVQAKDLKIDGFDDEAQRRINNRLSSLDIWFEKLAQATKDNDTDNITLNKSKIYGNVGYLIPALNIKGGAYGLVDYLKTLDWWKPEYGELAKEIAEQYKQEYESKKITESKITDYVSKEELDNAIKGNALLGNVVKSYRVLDNMILEVTSDMSKSYYKIDETGDGKFEAQWIDKEGKPLADRFVLIESKKVTEGKSADTKVKSSHIEDIGGGNNAVFGELEDGTYFSEFDGTMLITDVDMYPYAMKEDYIGVSAEHTLWSYDVDNTIKSKEDLDNYKKYYDIISQTSLYDKNALNQISNEINEAEKSLNESKKITEEEDMSYKDMSTEDLQAYMTDIINKREGIPEEDATTGEYLDNLYNEVDAEIQRRKQEEGKKMAEGKKVWSSEGEYVTDPEDEGFKDWLEANGYDEELANAEDEDERQALLNDYMEWYNETDNEVVSEDWEMNILPMIERQLDDNDLLILLGSAQTWRGRYDAGKVCRGIDDFSSLVADYDIIEFETNDSNDLSVDLVHHDGTHVMDLYTFNGDVEGIYNKLIELGISEFSDDQYEDFDDAYSYYDAGDFIDYLMDGHQEELKEFLVPIKWDM